jgi:hypothetical protein
MDLPSRCVTWIEDDGADNFSPCSKHATHAWFGQAAATWRLGVRVFDKR